ncbi:pyrimidine 5'-nucleotidase [Neisseriaceae bacterium TC5R-5]|nr:pyrimidine 5'-nucleotidase [Neisseriaceae bacterium TC5R-5]
MNNRITVVNNKTWIFDLDDTLHDASAAIFPRIHQAMGAYIMQHLQLDEAQATALRQCYWAQYGTTLRGLMTHHLIDAQDFLLQTHRLDNLLPWLYAEKNISDVLSKLPGRKMVFSNGPSHYVRAILQALGIRSHFTAHYGLEQLQYVSKPHISAFRTLLTRERLNPTECILVEDSLPNLLTAKKLGMTTIWVSQQARLPAYVDMRIRSIAELRRRVAQIK